MFLPRCDVHCTSITKQTTRKYNLSVLCNKNDNYYVSKEDQSFGAYRGNLRKYLDLLPTFLASIFSFLKNSNRNIKNELLKAAEKLFLELSVTSDVPQESILGPILFILYVNDLPDVIESSKFSLFADDIKVYKRVDSASDATSLQRDYYSINSWLVASGLIFNQTKCKCQRITRKKTPVEFPYNIKDEVLEVMMDEKDLGVWVSSDSAWAKHVLDCCAKANKTLVFCVDVQQRSKAQGLVASYTWR